MESASAQIDEKMTQFPSGFAVGATKPIPNKLGEVSFRRSF